jgi:uncharacterized protein (TIGR04255 family)
VRKPVRLPLRLGTEPLLEVVFELRFQPARDSVAELLPGILFDRLGDRYPQVAPLPLASVPPEIRRSEANLQYQAAHQLTGINERLYVGDRVVGYNRLSPYPGWAVVRADILQLAKLVKKSKFVGRGERLSLKSINFLEESSDSGQLAKLAVDLRIEEKLVPEDGLLLRAEFKDGPNVTILQIIPTARLTHGPHAGRSGMIIEVDCIRVVKEPDIWSAFAHELDRLHLRAKERFFSLLRPETLESLDPVYHGTI